MEPANVCSRCALPVPRFLAIASKFTCLMLQPGMLGARITRYRTPRCFAAAASPPTVVSDKRASSPPPPSSLDQSPVYPPTSTHSISIIHPSTTLLHRLAHAALPLSSIAGSTQLYFTASPVPRPAALSLVFHHPRPSHRLSHPVPRPLPTIY
ncbi:uncharacterized protein TRUGW13939_03271 [Talaromyces rugulosus]|uniref:Uncharacterized protein n=1 Tax=Talaromyces rugulosus TaxID=121627 RepID=A0A7H8QRU1_TALRU|nr:uncharacterized protein TRUGW13939_03271 [Talaromyces rugulosus]QKX56171.1 hypothetical protein TRUGW13939_03271 [Talaromyces rugulosus]